MIRTEELTRAEGVAPIPGAVRMLQELQDRCIAVITSAVRTLTFYRKGAAKFPILSQLITLEKLTEAEHEPGPFLLASRLFGTRL